METLGAAASIAGLVSLAIEIPKLIDTVISIQSAPEEAAQLSRTVDALVTTLRKLEAFLKTDEAQDMQMANDSALTVSISACQKRIVDLSRTLRKQTVPASTSSSANPMSKVHNVVRRFRWPLEKAECLSVITELHTMESTFEFCLVMKNCQQMSRSHKEVISHFRTQSQVLHQMASSFPEQAEHARSMLSKLEIIQLCIEKSIQKIDVLQIGVETLQEMNKDFAAYQADNLHGQALEWLSLLDTTLRHEEIKADRLPETCEWIIHDAEFLRWCQTLPSDDYNDISCWVGDPGHGKTYTMCRVVEHIQASYPADSDTYVTYLYCDYQRTSKYSVTSLVGALLRQLLSQFETIPEGISEIVRRSHLKLRRPSATMDELSDIVTHLAPRVKRIFICIDALDESPCAEEFVNACKKIRLEKSLFFIGRHSILQSLKRSYSSVSCRSIEPQKNDIYAVVAAKLATEAIRDPDLMPGHLRAQIKSRITRIADGMFLLATLHLTLVLSRNTVFQRRLALDDLPTTLPRAFSKTLARIQEHNHASQAFKILALIHWFGPLSVDLLQHMLAVESSHTCFQQDNLPSRLTMLDCCMGLVRVDTSKRPSRRRDTVVIAHETLSTYFNSNRNVLEDASAEIAGSFIAMLSFPASPALRDLWRFAARSWVSLLYDLETLPTTLSEMIWNNIVKLNHQIRNGNYDHLPKHAKRLLPKSPQSVSTVTNHQSTSGQSILHTACMLGLGGLYPIVEKCSSPHNENRHRNIGSFDFFGMTPLGWTLLPAEHFRTYERYQKEDKFARILMRAEKLISMYPRLEPIQALWTVEAMVKIQRIFPRDGVLHFFTAVPLLWFFSNHDYCPEAVHRCVMAIKQHWNLDIWDTIRPSDGNSILPATMDLEHLSDPVWRVVYAHSRELDGSVIHAPDGWQNKAQISRDEFDKSNFGEVNTHWPEPPPIPAHELFSNYIPIPEPSTHYALRVENSVLMVFAPGTAIHTPSRTVTLAPLLNLDYWQTQEDVNIHKSNTFPCVEVHVLAMSQEAFLRFGASSGQMNIFGYVPSESRHWSNFLDQNEIT